MFDFWVYSIASIFLVSLISFVGVLTISLRIERIKKILLYLVSFSAGALLGDSFIHLIPEVVEEHGFGLNVSLYILSGIILFFVIEKLIHWRHCHDVDCASHTKPFALMNLIGDAVHNFTDGLIIAASYFISVPLGVATTIAVILHEIPQEIGDFGVLVHGGLSRGRALFYNFITALTAFLGLFVFFLLSSYIEGVSMFLALFAAGGFIYIAGSDLIPELHKENNTKKSFIQFLFFILGILIMATLLFLE